MDVAEGKQPHVVYLQRRLLGQNLRPAGHTHGTERSQTLRLLLLQVCGLAHGLAHDVVYQILRVLANLLSCFFHIFKIIMEC